MIYFSPEAFEEYSSIGLVDGWAAYFCSRSAAMGPVSPEVVIGTFYNFNPDLVRRSVSWEAAAPPVVYAARLRSARRTLQRLLTEDGALLVPTGTLEILRPLVEACPPEGRPIAAPHAALPWPDDPVLGLWHGANVLREFRGDGHVAVLVSHGIRPVEALLLQAGYMGVRDRARAALFATRDWDEAAIARGRESMRERGFLNEDETLTDAGGKFRGMIEHDTDRAAAAPFAELGPERCEELLGLLEPLAVRILRRRAVPSRFSHMDPANPLPVR